MQNWQLILAATFPTVTALASLVTAIVLSGRIEARIEALRTEARGDTKDLRAEIKDVRQEVRADLAAMRGEMRSDLSAIRSEVRADLAIMRGEIAEVRTDIKALSADAYTAKREERKVS